MSTTPTQEFARPEEPALVAEKATRHRYSIKWFIFTGIILYHVLALLAFNPWFFSWTGVIVMVLGCYLVGTLGINIGFHRLLTHRGFRCAKWLERTLVVLGVCNMQEAPAYWVAVHRRHHQYADDEPDPHSPLISFLWAHVIWVCVEKNGETRDTVTARHAPDLMRDPFYRWLQGFGWFTVAFLSWGLYFLAGYFGALIAGQPTAEAVRMGASIFLWGVVIRTVVVWHITWSVNSVTHLWGYRTYATPDESRNNLWVALASMGEGWHNNHHADPTSARHGHRWWELDVSYITIRLLAACGLVTNVVMPSKRLATKAGESAA